MRPSKLSAKRAGPRMPRDTLCSGQKSHGHDHASYHRNHRSFARRRRFLWAGPLVVTGVATRKRLIKLFAELRAWVTRAATTPLSPRKIEPGAFAPEGSRVRSVAVLRRA